MKFAVLAIGLAGICHSAAAQVVIWSPRIDRSTGIATLVHLNTSQPGNQTAVGTMSVPVNHFVSGLEFTPDGRLWAAVQGPAGSMQQGLYAVDRTTGSTTFVGQPAGLAANEQLTDLAWNPVTHRLTGITAVQGGAYTTRLLNFDIYSGSVASAVTLTSANVKVLPVSVTCRASGQYFMLDLFNSIVARNQEDDIVFFNAGVSFTTGFNQGFGTDFSTGVIWFTAFRITNALQGAGVPELRTINPTNGADALVSIMGSNLSLFTDAAIQPAVNSCPADITNDHTVEDADFVSFASQYDALECGSPEMTGGCSGDFNFDGTVDDADFVLFAIAYDALVCP